MLCDRLGHPEWKDDSRFLSNNLRVKNRHILDDLIEKRTKEKTTQEWLELLEDSGMPYSAINDIQGTLNHTHGMFITLFSWLFLSSRYTAFSIGLLTLPRCCIVQARQMVQEIEHPACGPMKLVNTPVKYSHATPGIRSPPPTLGQHTDDVLHSILDLGEADIAALREKGVVA